MDAPARMDAFERHLAAAYADPDFLFEVIVSNSNALVMPYEVAQPHLPILPIAQRLMEWPLLLMDHIGIAWSLGYIPFDAAQAYIVDGDWALYMERWSLHSGDRVLYCRPSPRFGLHRFYTFYIHQPVNGSSFQINNVEFDEDYFLFEKMITGWDEEEEALEVIPEWGEIIFPGLDIREGNQEMVQFTDCNNKDWFMVVEYVDVWNTYVLTRGWNQFTTEHELAAGDIVRFFSPNFDTLNDKHFLIQFVKPRDLPRF